MDSHSRITGDEGKDALLTGVQSWSDGEGRTGPYTQPSTGKSLNPKHLNSLFTKYNVCQKRPAIDKHTLVSTEEQGLMRRSHFVQQLQIKNVPETPQCGLRDSAGELMFSNVTDRNDTRSWGRWL